MTTFALAKDFITKRRYQILDENASDGHIAFRFQLNTIQFWGNPEDEHFFFMTLPNFDEVTETNVGEIKENCHEINKQVKLVKLYVMNDVILAAAEVYYLAEEDFEFQMMNALRHLVSAKAMYKKLGE